MALGLPTVAFDNAVNRDVLGPDGVFAPIADDTQLARKLLDLLEDESEMAARGRSLRRRAEQLFSWNVASRQILDVYEALLRK
jgi:glycosyltransferase involved in cell wall biosynthesis